MAILDLREIGGRRGRRGEIGRRNHIRRFWIRTDQATDDSKVILDAMPALYTPHPSDSKAILVEADCFNLDNSFKVWIAEAEYSTEYTRNVTPLEEPPDIDLDYETRQELVTGAYRRDESGALTRVGLVNSAGEPIRGVSKEASRLILTYTRNEEDLPFLSALPFYNAVNSEPWNGLDKRQAYCRGIKRSAQFFEGRTTEEPDLAYWRVMYTFVLDFDNHDLKIADAGTYYLEYGEGSQNATRVPFTAENGSPLLQGALDGSDPGQPGKKLGFDDDGKPLPVQFLKYGEEDGDGVPVYHEVDFNPLNINLDLTAAQVKRKRAA